MLASCRTTTHGGLQRGGFETVVPSPPRDARQVAEPQLAARRSAPPQAAWHPSQVGARSAHSAERPVLAVPTAGPKAAQRARIERSVRSSRFRPRDRKRHRSYERHRVCEPNGAFARWYGGEWATVPPEHREEPSKSVQDAARPLPSL